jgi:hypothetical protein
MYLLLHHSKSLRSLKTFGETTLLAHHRERVLQMYLLAYQADPQRRHLQAFPNPHLGWAILLAHRREHVSQTPLLVQSSDLRRGNPQSLLNQPSSVMSYLMLEKKMHRLSHMYLGSRV